MVNTTKTTFIKEFRSWRAARNFAETNKGKVSTRYDYNDFLKCITKTYLVRY